MSSDAPSRSIDRHLADGCCICYGELLDSDDGSHFLSTCAKCFKSFHFACVLDLRTSKCPMCNEEVFAHPPSRHRNELVEEVAAKLEEIEAHAKKKIDEVSEEVFNHANKKIDELCDHTNKKIDEVFDHANKKIDEVRAEANQEIVEAQKVVCRLEKQLRSKDQECQNLLWWRDYWWKECDYWWRESDYWWRESKKLRWSEPKWWNGYHTRRY